MTKLAKDATGNTLPAFRWGRKHPIPVGDEQSVSEPFGEQTSVVGVESDADFRFRLGKIPVVDETCPRIRAGERIALRIFGGERMAVIMCDEPGELEIVEME